jgi:hypothetical protein
VRAGPQTGPGNAKPLTFSRGIKRGGILVAQRGHFFRIPKRSLSIYCIHSMIWLSCSRSSGSLASARTLTTWRRCCLNLFRAKPTSCRDKVITYLTFAFARYRPASTPATHENLWLLPCAKDRRRNDGTDTVAGLGNGAPTAAARRLATVTRLRWKRS